eukprot:1162233-Amphidinium_carterae.2
MSLEFTHKLIPQWSWRRFPEKHSTKMNSSLRRVWLRARRTGKHLEVVDEEVVVVGVLEVAGADVEELMGMLVEEENEELGVVVPDVVEMMMFCLRPAVPTTTCRSNPTTARKYINALITKSTAWEMKCTMMMRLSVMSHLSIQSESVMGHST